MRFVPPHAANAVAIEAERLEREAEDLVARALGPAHNPVGSLFVDRIVHSRYIEYSAIQTRRNAFAKSQ